MSAIFNEMLARLRANGDDERLWPCEAELKQWTGQESEAVSGFFDGMARILASNYASRELSFEEGDLIATHLWGLMVTGYARVTSGWSNDLREVYDAFDAGEMSAQAPTEVTDPAITAILARLRQSH